MSRMCPATDSEKVQIGGHCRPAKVLVNGPFSAPFALPSELAEFRLLIRRLWVRVPPEGHRNSDHARDLPIHESVLERIKHCRRGLSMPETLSTPGS